MEERVANKPIVDGKPIQGIYRGLTVAEYEAIPALRWSRLSNYLTSPAHGLAGEKSADDAEYLDFGQAVHTAVLEPTQLGARFAAIPEDAPIRRGKDNLAWWARFQSENAGKTLLKLEKLEEVKVITKVVYEHPTVNALLTHPKAAKEVVVVWMDKEFGMWCKARLDLVTKLRVRGGELSYLVDVKTSADGSPEGFGRAIADFEYHGQLAFYKRGLQAVAPFERQSGFIVIEKKIPVVAFYTLDDDSLAIGEARVAKAVSVYLNAQTTGKWPGYPDGIVSLPPWKLKGRE